MDTRVVRTISADYLSTHKALGLDFVPSPNSTMNQKFNIFPKELPRKGEYPNIRYLVIGRGGAKISTSTNGYPIPVQKVHRARDAALFDHLPFVVRRVSEDLNPVQRANYRLRTLITSKSGETYVAYYGKYLDVSNVTVNMELRHVENGKITTTAFEHNVGDLTPKAVEHSNINKNDPNADCLVVTAKVDAGLNDNDIKEIIHACSIIDGDSNSAILSEIGVASALDRRMEGIFGTAKDTYVEAISAQISAFVFKYVLLDETMTNLDLVLDFGASELLLL